MDGRLTQLGMDLVLADTESRDNCHHVAAHCAQFDSQWRP